jgi:glycyl-tRNA synthetase beta chain
MITATLLVELFTEELPPKALKRLGEVFADQILNGLIRAQLKLRDPREVRFFATPRRLAVVIPDVLAKAPYQNETRKLMPSKVAFDAGGHPTAALLKRLEKEGASAEHLERKVEGNVEYAFLNQTINGVTLAVGLQAAVEEAIAKLPIPKVMSYQLADGQTTVQFVRPAHGLVALHGAEVVAIKILGLDAGRVVHGHRFQGSIDIELKHANEYEGRLEKEGAVIADFDVRRKEIHSLLRARAEECGDSLGEASDYLGLLDEVTALVERPAVYVGSFDAEFLAVPSECLVLTMRQNQKYFPLFHEDGSLSNRFLIVSNMRLVNPRNVIQGNERVVRPRLSDARFFFETDKKTRLDARVPKLASVVYHNKLGSLLERMQRVQALAGSIATALGTDPAPAERAAYLAKADLLTDMVGEFPELQGAMGRYYALHDGEPVVIADAIAQHYLPRFSGDALPVHPVAIAVALADKLETLAGMFGIGQQPTGEKDPLALRRYALAVIRIMIEGKLSVSLFDLVSAAFAVFPRGLIGNANTDLLSFIFDRLRGYLRESGYSANEVEAVLCMNPVRLDLIPGQLAAVRAFTCLPEAGSLAAANKRIANILRQAEARGESFRGVEAGALKEPAERALFDALKSASNIATPLFKNGDYTGYLQAFSVLKIPVDAFFDSVMVMVDDASLRQNRLALLADLQHEMNRVADISKLAT